MSTIEIPDRTCTRHGCFKTADVWAEIGGATRVVCETHAGDADVVICRV